MARPRQTSDTEILDAARRCFLEEGPQTSTQRIADRLGVSQASIFKRFGTKRDLMLAALSPAAEPPFLHTLLDGPDERPVEDQLATIVRDANCYMAELIPRLHVLRAAGLDPRDILARYPVPPPLRTHQALCGWLARCREQGRIRDVDPNVVATVLLGALHGRAFFEQVVGQTTAPTHESTIRSMVDLLWAGLAPVAEEQC